MTVYDELEVFSCKSNVTKGHGIGKWQPGTLEFGRMDGASRDLPYEVETAPIVYVFTTSYDLQDRNQA